MFKFSKQKNNSQKNKGFTIVESLVAIFILIISVTGPLYFTQGALRVAFVARDQVTAFFLAQDAIEYIKNVRDRNSISYLNGVPTTSWLEGLSDCIGGDGCIIDTDNGSIRRITNTTSDPILKIDTTNVGNPELTIFNHTSGDDSIYKRSVSVEEIVSDIEAIITVTITWDTHETIGTRTIQVKEHIFNWAVNL